MFVSRYIYTFHAIQMCLLAALFPPLIGANVIFVASSCSLYSEECRTRTISSCVHTTGCCALLSANLSAGVFVCMCSKQNISGNTLMKMLVSLTTLLQLRVTHQLFVFVMLSEKQKPQLLGLFSFFPVLWPWDEHKSFMLKYFQLA